MIHEISDCKINTSQTVMYPIYNSMRCTEVLAVKQSYQMIHGQWIYRYTPVYHLVHHLQTPSTELNIVYMWGFLITLEVMTPPEPDRWTCRLLVPGPSLVLWLPSVTTDSSSSGGVTFLDHHSPLPKPCLRVHPRKIFIYQKTYMYTQ